MKEGKRPVVQYPVGSIVAVRQIHLRWWKDISVPEDQMDSGSDGQRNVEGQLRLSTPPGKEVESRHRPYLGSKPKVL